MSQSGWEIVGDLKVRKVARYLYRQPWDKHVKTSGQGIKRRKKVGFPCVNECVCMVGIEREMIVFGAWQKPKLQGVPTTPHGKRGIAIDRNHECEKVWTKIGRKGCLGLRERAGIWEMWGKASTSIDWTIERIYGSACKLRFLIEMVKWFARKTTSSITHP